MTIEERKKQMFKMSDQELLQTILSYPDKDKLNIDKNGQLRRYPSANMARKIYYSLRKYPGSTITDKQRWAMVTSFIECSEEPSLSSISDTQPIIYKHQILFRLKGSTKASTAEYLTKLQPWTDLLNNTFRERYIKQRATNVTFSSTVKRGSPTAGYDYTITIESSSELTPGAKRVCEYYFRNQLKNYIVDNLKQNRYMFNGDLYIPETDVTPYPYYSKHIRTKEQHVTVEQLKEHSIRSSLYYRTDEKDINRGYLHAIEGEYVYIMPAGPRQNINHVNILNGVSCVHINDVYFSEHDLIAANNKRPQQKDDDFTKAVNELSSKPTEQSI